MSQDYNKDILADLQKELKHPIATYQPRLDKFLRKMDKVKAMQPKGFHLWKVMDTVAFEDTETALETTIYNVVVGPRLEARRANQNKRKNKPVK